MNKIYDSITSFFVFVTLTKATLTFIVKNGNTRRTFELYFTMNL